MLSNILLDELDKELERRGHKFCRYADDSNVYVQSRSAGERVRKSLTMFLERRLRLKVNAEKSAVARPWDRKFLGYSFTTQHEARLKVAPTFSATTEREAAGNLSTWKRMQPEAVNRRRADTIIAWLDELLPAGRGEGNLRGTG